MKKTGYERVTAQSPHNPALDREWFVVQSKPHKEAFASLQLANQGYEAFLPKLRRTVRHARRVKHVERALFPRYLFVRLDLSKDAWRSVNGTFGVSRVITDGDRPLSVPKGLVERMIYSADTGGVIDLTPTLVCGNAVQMLDGPFAGQLGRLLKLDGAGRAQVLLQILGAEREVAVSAAILAPAGESVQRR